MLKNCNCAVLQTFCPSFVCLCDWLDININSIFVYNSFCLCNSFLIFQLLCSYGQFFLNMQTKQIWRNGEEEEQECLDFNLSFQMWRDLFKAFVYIWPKVVKYQILFNQNLFQFTLSKPTIKNLPLKFFYISITSLIWI